MKTAPVSRTTIEPYAWGAGCRGWHLVRTETLSVIQEEMPPGAEEVRHLHLRARQFFFVLTGVVVIECDGVRHQLTPGSGLEVAPLTPHQVRNESTQSTEFLVVSQPPSHGDREAAQG